MQDCPTATELIAAARQHLEAEVIPSLQDPGVRFRTRVAANVLAIVERELALAPAYLVEELARLSALLEAEALTPVSSADLVDSVERETRRLWERVQSGDYDGSPRRQLLLDHLKQTAIEKLRIANPKYLARVGRG